MKRGLLIVALCFPMALHALEPQRRTWRDTFQSRVEILALLQTLHAGILAASSATERGAGGLR